MIRFILFILILFIVINVARSLLKAFRGSERDFGKPKKPKSKYDDVEEAKFKDIDNESKKNDNT